MTSTLRTIACIATVLCALALSPEAAFATDKETVGVTDFTFEVKARDLPVKALVFYPAASGGTAELVGDDAVFHGTAVWRHALPSRGKHPLILLSHGSGGSAALLGWIAARLAAEGFVVIAPNHPGSTSRDSRPETSIKVWQRAMDMSALLDAVGSSSSLQRFVDTSSVTALGFSLGGHTALALGGARVSATAYARYCDDRADAEDCIWYDRGNSFVSGHVDLHRIDAALFDAGYRDNRVTRVVAIDPALAPAVTTASLGEIKVPVLVLNLGEEGTIPAGVNGKDIASGIAGGTYMTVEGGNHFSFLARCRTFSWLWLILDGDDPVCADSGSASRDAIHDEITAKLLAFLKRPQS